MCPMPSRNPQRAREAYSAEHVALRTRLIAELPTPCARCGGIIPRGIDSKLIHLDHIDNAVSEGGRAGYGALSHAHCNQSHGAKLGLKQRAEREMQKVIAKAEKENPTEQVPFFSESRTSR